MKYLVVTIHSHYLEKFRKLKKQDKKNQWFLISDKEKLTYDRVKKINPEYIFVPHWSWIIKKEIWSNWNTVVFHMTDLPYGRGGTPLQNLISRGHKTTKLSALKVNAGLDTGDIYKKIPLSLKGTADEIMTRSSEIIFQKMIPFIVKNNPKPKKQTGKAVVFQRRKPHQSKIVPGMDLKKAHDMIRMLDGEGYPNAFVETKKLRFTFKNAKMGKGSLSAEVEIYEK